MNLYLVLCIGIVLGLVLYHLITDFGSVYCPTQDEIAQKLLRQTSRWLAASEQDRSPLISMLHAMYGYGYFMAMQDVVADKTISRYVSVPEYVRHLNAAMDGATKKVATLCPKFMSELDPYLARFGGDM